MNTVRYNRYCGIGSFYGLEKRIRKIYTRKISRAKYNKHKEITFRSLKNYSVDVYKEALEKVSLPNYDNFYNPDLAYSDFISRLESVINSSSSY